MMDEQSPKLIPASQFDTEHQVWFLMDYYQTVAATQDDMWRLGIRRKSKIAGKRRFTLSKFNPEARYFASEKTFHAATVTEAIDKGNKLIQSRSGGGA